MSGCLRGPSPTPACPPSGPCSNRPTWERCTSCSAPMVPAPISSPTTSRIMKPPSRSTGMARSSSVKQQVRAYIAARQPPAITEAVWGELLMQLAPVSESYVRELLTATGLPFEQPYAGIRQHTFEELEHSLCEM